MGPLVTSMVKALSLSPPNLEVFQGQAVTRDSVLLKRIASMNLAPLVTNTNTAIINSRPKPVPLSFTSLRSARKPSTSALAIAKSYKRIT